MNKKRVKTVLRLTDYFRDKPFNRAPDMFIDWRIQSALMYRLYINRTYNVVLGATQAGTPFLQLWRDGKHLGDFMGWRNVKQFDQPDAKSLLDVLDSYNAIGRALE